MEFTLSLGKEEKRQVKLSRVAVTFSSNGKAARLDIVPLSKIWGRKKKLFTAKLVKVNGRHMLLLKSTTRKILTFDRLDSVRVDVNERDDAIEVRTYVTKDGKRAFFSYRAIKVF